MSGPNHLPLDRIVEGLARHGVEGRIHPGAQGRSARMYATNGYNRGMQANVVHHTVSSGANPANDIRYIIGGKGDGYVIANAYAPPTGGIDLLASGPTYTEGAGGPIGLIPAGGGVRVCNSIEIANWGDGIDVYEPVQCRSVLAWAAVCGELGAELWGWHDDPFSYERLFSHFEWAPGRKVDPRGPSFWAARGDLWDMDAFRADARIAAAAAKPTPKPLPPPEPLPELPKDVDDMLNRDTLTIRKHKSGALWLTTATSVQPIEEDQRLHYVNPKNFDPPVPETTCSDKLHAQYSALFS